MRSESNVATGYKATELDQWAKRAQQWASGKQPDDLPYVAADQRAKVQPRDAFIYFISAAKERNPAAATALIERLALINRLGAS
jgi:uncharacterized protein YecE (DUF72 family)